MVLSTAMTSIVFSTAMCHHNNSLYPDIAETSHASSEAVRFFRGFFSAKTADKASTADFYNPKQSEYYDSTLGIAIGANASEVATNVKRIEATWAKTPW